MAYYNFKKGLLANLPAAKAEDTFYVVTDERALYVDIDANTRIRLGDFQEFASLAALKANTNPSTSALYYVADINCLAKFNGTDYVQINLDTGATDVEVVGDGNAVTEASYDPATRKLTLTKGTTFAVPGDITAAIGELKIGDASYDTVKAYVDKKTEGIASDTAVSALGDRVTSAEGKLNTIVGEDTNKSARAIAAEEVAKIVDGAPESLDTLKEISDWISGHKDDASAMNSAIKALEAIVDGIGGEGEEATVVAYVTKAIDALKIGDYAKAADLTALAERVTTAEGKLTTLTGSGDGSVAKALSDAKAYTDEKNTAMDGRMTAAEGSITTLTGSGAGSVSKALVDAKAYTDEKDTAMDGRVSTAETDLEAIKAALTVGTF